MKKLVIVLGLTTALAIGCAMGSIAHDLTVPTVVAQTTPSTAGPCNCVESSKLVQQCVCNGLNCLVYSSGWGTGVSCVPN